ncbi:hypothetical protein GL4_1531 [Methyloceanibacter caenitepidi]|uniref:Uncharacterized protein n=1 Tax=Methyloceanibacter caenitepidi TaxID=1384459 RepID=A0A0A8K373_9HYPH|nr:hypothetical protein GL4_1531 [Methyloceanibacter caenitepidi]
MTVFHARGVSEWRHHDRRLHDVATADLDSDQGTARFGGGPKPTETRRCPVCQMSLT